MVAMAKSKTKKTGREGCGRASILSIIYFRPQSSVKVEIFIAADPDPDVGIQK